MRPPMKYDPYQGYGYGKPWLWYRGQSVPKRIRTRNDWHYNLRPWTLGIYQDLWIREWEPRDAHHCRHCSSGSTYRKRIIHRAFRHHAKALVREHLRESDLDAFPKSHVLVESGDWLD